MRDRVITQMASEEGSALVIAAVLTIAIAMLGGLVLQVGDWMEHRRHAQLRVDAAALAGGQLFGQCFDPANYTSAQVLSNMSELAKHYGGYASTVPGAPLNAKFGGGTATPLVFQSKTYPNGGGGGPDDTSTATPCDSMAFDVKLQDTAIPPLMSLFPQATVHAHARMEMQQINSFKGAFPLAIPEVEPKYVAATFVDEATGNELTGCGATGLLAGTTCTYGLTKGTTANNVSSWAASVIPSLPSAGVTAATAKAVGVRIGMGPVAGSCAGTAGTENWACFDAGNNNRGALMIRDYASGSGGAAQPAAPILRAVYPTNSCAPSSALQFGATPFVSDAGGVTSCSVGVSARIDFGTGAINPTLAKASGGVKAVVNATINGNTIGLAPVAGSYDATTTTWMWSPSTGSATVPVADAGTTSGYPVSMAWQEQDGSQGGNSCNTSNGNKCTGTFNNVARFTSATGDDEGPIKLMSLTQAGAPAYALKPGLQTVDVEIRIQASLGFTQPPVLQSLRLTHTGSRTTAVNCDGTGASDFNNSIISGCKTPYQVNDDQVCPDPTPPAGPKDCVPVKTGNLGTTVIKAMDDRFADCPPDRWATEGASHPGDPRLIVMLLTDFSAYGAQGKTEVPVIGFAGFYVIGWSGNKCGASWPFAYAEPNGGNIWGYFVKYASLTQVPNGKVCDLASINPCTPVLVR